jgi:hypothetical protein
MVFGGISPAGVDDPTKANPNTAVANRILISSPGLRAKARRNEDEWENGGIRPGNGLKHHVPEAAFPQSSTLSVIRSLCHPSPSSSAPFVVLTFLSSFAKRIEKGGAVMLARRATI